MCYYLLSCHDVSPCNFDNTLQIVNKEWRNAAIKRVSLTKDMPQGSILGTSPINISINHILMFINELTLYNDTEDNSSSCTYPPFDNVVWCLRFNGNRAIKWLVHWRWDSRHYRHVSFYGYFFWWQCYPKSDIEWEHYYCLKILGIKAFGWEQNKPFSAYQLIW